MPTAQHPQPMTSDVYVTNVDPSLRIQERLHSDRPHRSELLHCGQEGQLSKQMMWEKQLRKLDVHHNHNSA